MHIHWRYVMFTLKYSNPWLCHSIKLKYSGCFVGNTVFTPCQSNITGIFRSSENLTIILFTWTHSPCHSRHIPDQLPRLRTHTDTATAASSLSTVDKVTLLKFSSVTPLSSVCLHSFFCPWNLMWPGIYPLAVSESVSSPTFIDHLKLVNNCWDSLPNLTHCHTRSMWSLWRNKRAKGLRSTLISQNLLNICMCKQFPAWPFLFSSQYCHPKWTILLLLSELTSPKC